MRAGVVIGPGGRMNAVARLMFEMNTLLDAHLHAPARVACSSAQEIITCRDVDGIKVLMVAPAVACQRDNVVLWIVGLLGLVLAFAFPIAWVWIRRRDMRLYEKTFPEGAR